MKVESYKIKGWEEGVIGVLIKENEEWVLIGDISSDYHVDGYALLRKSKIKKRSTKDWENQVALVLSLQKYEPSLRKGFKFGSLESMLKWIQKEYGIFAFQDKIEESMEVGTMEDITDKVLGLNFLMTDGRYDDDYIYDYKVNQIRKVSFGTHYLNALDLLQAHHAE